MNIGIGIDTGGTCTDAVIFDFETQKVLAKGKTLTTREDLTIGIGTALDSLPVDLVNKATIVALSTTLATNASVEDKGSRAKLLLLGTTRKVLDWIDAESIYGLSLNDTYCVDTHSSFNGKFIDEPDWDHLLSEAHDWLRDADALSVVEVSAIHNGGICEKNAKMVLETHCKVPVITGSELADGLNVMERGATALLNAQLLPIIQEFMEAVSSVLQTRHIHAPAMIVRSDGSLMSDTISRNRPVETILSGPAASVLGGKGLTNCQNCLVVDMGGTTTDISLIQDGSSTMVDQGIRIGGWRTQVKGISLETVALGGDSAIRIQNGKLTLCSRRVQPLCVASSKWPEIRQSLQRLIDQERIHSYPIHEFLSLIRAPKDRSRYSIQELTLCESLKAGPLILEEAAQSVDSDIYNLKSERLETEGIIMRCGLTPTDIMHIKGDYSPYDRDASVLAAQFMIRCLPDYFRVPEALTVFADTVYDQIHQKLYENILRILILDKYPSMKDQAMSEQVRFLITQSWINRNNPIHPFFDIQFVTGASLIGIGAPTHVFLPGVAQALGTKCIIPEHAEVANAVGAVIADISAQAKVEISPNYTATGIDGYTIYTSEGSFIHDTLENATHAATQAAIHTATKKARNRGALGELSIKTDLSNRSVIAKQGESVDLGSTTTAIVSGRIHH